MVALGAVAAPAPAQATTVTFAFGDTSLGTAATGSFSYQTGLGGVLGYDDLTAFQFSYTGGQSYDLNFVRNIATQYRYFGYDTTARDFVANPSLCGSAGCFPTLLGATTANFSQGFDFAPLPHTTEVAFSFKLSSFGPVASGVFSFPQGKTGVLGFDDLSSFILDIRRSVGSDTFDLDFVRHTATQYVYFGYDTTTNSFIENPNLCGSLGCFDTLLNADSADFTQGFGFTPIGPISGIGSYGDLNSKFSGLYDELSFGAPLPSRSVYADYARRFSGLYNELTLEEIPEPGSGMLLVGLLGLATLRRIAAL